MRCDIVGGAKAWLTRGVDRLCVLVVGQKCRHDVAAGASACRHLPLRRIDLAVAGRRLAQASRLLREKLPFFALAAAAAAVSVMAKQQAIHSRWKYGLGVRIADCVYGLAFYFGRRWRRSIYRRSTHGPQAVIHGNGRSLLSGALVLLITAMLWIKRKSWPAGLICWLYYIVSLLPMLGIRPIRSANRRRSL